MPWQNSNKSDCGLYCVRTNRTVYGDIYGDTAALRLVGTIAKYTRLTATHMACDSEGQRCAVVYSMDMSRMWSQSMYICWKGGKL